MSVTRKLPGTNITRQISINRANEANTNPPGGVNPLTGATITRVTTQAPLYNQAMTAVATAKANLNTNTPLKDVAVNTCRLFVNHFIQVFNLGVARGKYPAGHRAYYHLETDSGALPDLGTEDLVKVWAHNLVEGDAVRLANGGLPMANPDISEVQAALTAMDTQLTSQANLKFILDEKQEAVDAQNILVDPIIKRVWDETETYFGEETPESKRANARLWGVVYVTEGPPATLSGLVKTVAGVPWEGITVTILETGATAITNHEGRYTMDTTILGVITVKATVSAAASGSQTVNIPEHEDEINVSVADIVIG
jgi:hypothetical protein